MIFARERFCHHLQEEILPLLQAHYLEIARWKDIPLDPDWQTYQMCDQIGTLRIFTARGPDGRLLGYAVFFVRANAHYQSSLQAVQDILFLQKQARVGSLGYKFIKWCDAELKADGVQVVYHHVKAAHDFGPMLARMGYEKIDVVYGRRLDKE